MSDPTATPSTTAASVISEAPAGPVAPARPRRARQRRRRLLRRILLLLFVLALAGGGLWLWQRRKQGVQKPLQEPIKLARGAVEERLLENGTVVLRRTIEVKSTMSGKIKRLLVEEGDLVQQDQVLAIIEPDPNEILRLYQKRAAVESRRIELQERALELERSRSLHERGVMPGDQFEAIENQHKVALTQYDLALLELQTLEKEINPDQAHQPLAAGTHAAAGALDALTDVQVQSPISGIVIRRPTEEGELVVSGVATTIAGTTLLELGDLAEIVIQAEVNEVDIGRVRASQTVEVKFSAYPDETFQAGVHRIAPIGQTPPGQSTVSFNVELRLAQLDPRLRPAMTCDLDILVEHKEDAPYLPFDAVFQDRKEEEQKKPQEADGAEAAAAPAPAAPDQKPGEEEDYLDYVWVKSGEDWVKREVKLGLKGELRVEIIEGVTEEDLVYPDGEEMRRHEDEKAGKAAPKPEPEHPGGPPGRRQR